MIEKPLVLIVGTDRGQLDSTAQQLEAEGYAVVCAASLEDIDRVIAGQSNVRLALIDLTGFDQTIWDRCDSLRQQKIPYIVITPQRSPAVQRDSTEHGASGLLVKTVGVKEIVNYVHTLLGD
jgi:DNA-binding response OmpR family regulator